MEEPNPCKSINRLLRALAWCLFALVKLRLNYMGTGPVPEEFTMKAGHPDWFRGHTDSQTSGSGRPQGADPGVLNSQHLAATPREFVIS